MKSTYSRRRIVRVLVIDNEPRAFCHVEGAYETPHFIMLPTGGRLATCATGNEHWFGKRSLLNDGSRTDHYSLSAWNRSTARKTIAAK